MAEKYVCIIISVQKNSSFHAIFQSWPRHTVLDVLNHRVMEYKKQLASERADLDTTREQLSRAQAQEASLVHQNGRMSMELVAAEKREKKLEKQVSGLEKKLSTEAARFARVEEEWKSERLKQEKELERVRKELNEKGQVLQEYQDKVSRVCNYIDLVYMCTPYLFSSLGSLRKCRS